MRSRRFRAAMDCAHSTGFHRTLASARSQRRPLCAGHEDRGAAPRRESPGRKRSRDSRKRGGTGVSATPRAGEGRGGCRDVRGAVLVVRPSSLGDIVHAAGARRRHPRRTAPELAVDWVAEDAFAPLLALDPRYPPRDPAALRRWRRHVLVARNLARDGCVPRASAARRVRRRARSAGAGEGRADRAARARRAARSRPREHPRADRDARRTTCITAIDPDQHLIDRCRQLRGGGTRLRGARATPRFGLVAPPAGVAAYARSRPTSCSCTRRAAPTSCGRKPSWRTLIAAFAARDSRSCCPGGRADGAQRAASASPPARRWRPCRARQSLPRARGAARARRARRRRRHGPRAPRGGARHADGIAVRRDRREARRRRACEHAGRAISVAPGGCRPSPKSRMPPARFCAQYRRADGGHLRSSALHVALVSGAAVPAAAPVVARTARARLPRSDRRALRSVRRRHAAGGPVLWVHAVSLGETRAAAPLVDRARSAFPDATVLVTHMTATGRAAGRALVRPTRRAGVASLRRAVRRARLPRALEAARGPHHGDRAVAEPRRGGAPARTCRSFSSTRGCRSARRRATHASPSLTRPMLAALAGVAAQSDGRRGTARGTRRAVHRSSPAISSSTSASPMSALTLGRELKARFGERARRVGRGARRATARKR